MRKLYLYYNNGTKQLLTESEAEQQKAEIIAAAKTLATVPEVLDYCTHNFVIGPMDEDIAEALLSETEF